MNTDRDVVGGTKKPMRKMVNEGGAKHRHEGGTCHVEREVHAEIDTCPCQRYAQQAENNPRESQRRGE